MTEPRQSAIAVAAAIIAFEKGRAEAGGGRGGVERVVIGKLQVSLGKVIGSSAVNVLLARAVRLAQRAEPALAAVTAGPGGPLSGVPHAPPGFSRRRAGRVSPILEIPVLFIRAGLT